VRQGGPLPTGTPAKVGGVELTQADLDTAMQRRLTVVRQQNPQATYADLAPEFDAIVDSLIQERTLWAYARKHGFTVSKKLIDAEIVKIPGVQGLDGRFSEAAYQGFLREQRITDAMVRREIETSLLQRLVRTPVAANDPLLLITGGMALAYGSPSSTQADYHIGLKIFQKFAGFPKTFRQN